MQRDLLPLIEGTTVSTKYGPVKTDHVLFIASGAFHAAKPSDLLPELQGRLPIRVELKPLTTEDLRRILVEPEASLIKQYIALMATENVTLKFADDAIDALADIAAQVNSTVENIGARRLQTVMERVLDEISFDATDKGGETILIDAAYVRGAHRRPRQERRPEQVHPVTVVEGVRPLASTLEAPSPTTSRGSDPFYAASGRLLCSGRNASSGAGWDRGRGREDLGAVGQDAAEGVLGGIDLERGTSLERGDRGGARNLPRSDTHRRSPIAGRDRASGPGAADPSSGRSRALGGSAPRPMEGSRDAERSVWQRAASARDALRRANSPAGAEGPRWAAGGRRGEPLRRRRRASSG